MKDFFESHAQDGMKQALRGEAWELISQAENEFVEMVRTSDEAGVFLQLYGVAAWRNQPSIDFLTFEWDDETPASVGKDRIGSQDQRNRRA